MTTAIDITAVVALRGDCNRFCQQKESPRRTFSLTLRAGEMARNNGGFCVKNAHERFGRLLYRRQTEKASTNLCVLLDAFMGEVQGKAHLVSVVGGDVEIGALAAAFANGDSFTVMDPYGDESIVNLGENPLCFRGSITIPRRKRPLRHLVSCSQGLADTAGARKVLVNQTLLRRQ